jgi:oligopeptide/dipeptide ABC transporter ATP-binding protein
MTALLEVEDLSIRFPTPQGVVHALENVSLTVNRGETVGLVGESGSGKSTLALAVMRAITPSAGHLRFDGQEVGHLRGKALRPLRRRLQMVFQDPYSSLDPRMTIHRILAEPLLAQGWSRARIAARVPELLDAVGLPQEAATRRPAQFSGGQRQRIAIARAIAPGPEMIVADEPVSALDVSIQAQIVNLMQDLSARNSLAWLVIAHDLPLVHQIADRIVVLYLGRIVEEGPAEDIIAQPLHPYTAGLLAATPTVDNAGRARLKLKGEPPNPINRPSGCPFHPRCPVAEARCATDAPRLQRQGSRRVACHLPGAVPPPLTFLHKPPEGGQNA